MKLLASLALLAFVTWAAHAWLGLFDNIYLGAAAGLAILFTYAFIYDRLRASRRQ